MSGSEPVAGGSGGMEGSGDMDIIHVDDEPDNNKSIGGSADKRSTLGTASVKKIDYSQSPFFLGNFYTRVGKDQAKCNSCPDAASLIKRTDGNTSGLESHLSRKHPEVFEKFIVKKEVLVKRDEIKMEKDSRKRRASGVVQDLHKTKQIKLGTKAGNLNLFAPPPDPKVQKEWDDAMVDFVADTFQSFSSVSGKPFKKVVDVINKRCR